MSPDKASSRRGSSKSNAADWDIPCLNCGRYGTFPGQMMTDHVNRTFCSPDCGWSFVLRPTEEARAAKAMRAMQVARANQQHENQHQRRSRSKRASRQAYMAHQLRAQAHLDHRPSKHANAPHPASPSSADKPPRGPPGRTSSSSPRPPPPAPTSPKLDRRAEASRRSPSKRYSSNAMFEYSMAYQNMSLHT